MLKIIIIGFGLLNCNFQSLYSQSENTCPEILVKTVEPFLGKWNEFTITENESIFLGTLHTAIELEGCVISQNFISADSSFAYQSFGYIDPASNVLKETYVFTNGNISEYEWMVNAEDIITRRTGGTRKLDYIHQLRLTRITGQQYDVIEEHSNDGGKTWQQVELTRIIRIK